MKCAWCGEDGTELFIEGDTRMLWIVYPSYMMEVKSGSNRNSAIIVEIFSFFFQSERMCAKLSR